MDLIPPELLEAVGTILTSGAITYSERNWEQGMKWGRCYGALLRHMTAWWGGKDLDDETKKSHLWHAACCITFLLTYEMRGMSEFDDRPSHETIWYTGLFISLNNKPGETLCVHYTASQSQATQDGDEVWVVKPSQDLPLTFGRVSGDVVLVRRLD